jgi:hypothetical protein
MRPTAKPKAALPRRLYNIDEFAEVTGQCRASVYNGMADGRIPFVIDGGRRKIPIEFLDQQIAKAMKQFDRAIIPAGPGRGRKKITPEAMAAKAQSAKPARRSRKATRADSTVAAE